MDKILNILILGGGGHAKVLLEAIRTMGNFKVAGILDDRLPAGCEVNGVKVLGGDSLLSQWAGKSSVAIGFGITRAGDQRKKVYESCREKHFDFPVIRHGGAIIAPNVELGDGAQIMAGVVIQPNARIGANVIVNTSAVIEHDALIGPHSHIAPGAVLGGGVEVGECSLVGLGARVLPGVKIGRHVTIGAGVVVLRDVPDEQTFVGIS